MPILKVVDRGTGIECDISVENRDGVSKSKIVHMICSIDERFGKLSFLVSFLVFFNKELFSLSYMRIGLSASLVPKKRVEKRKGKYVFAIQSCVL